MQRRWCATAKFHGVHSSESLSFYCMRTAGTLNYYSSQNDVLRNFLSSNSRVGTFTAREDLLWCKCTVTGQIQESAPRTDIFKNWTATAIFRYKTRLRAHNQIVVVLSLYLPRFNGIQHEIHGTLLLHTRQKSGVVKQPIICCRQSCKVVF